MIRLNGNKRGFEAAGFCRGEQATRQGLGTNDAVLLKALILLNKFSASLTLIACSLCAIVHIVCLAGPRFFVSLFPWVHSKSSAGLRFIRHRRHRSSPLYHHSQLRIALCSTHIPLQPSLSILFGHGCLGTSHSAQLHSLYAVEGNACYDHL